METLAFILSISGLIMGVSASIIKGKKMGLTLLCVLLSNFLMATSYVVEVIIGKDSLNGAISCYIGCLLAGINFLFQRKDKDIPKWLIGIYALVFITANLCGGITWLSVLSIVACLTFIGGIAQKSGKGYRTWHAINSSLWCTYDILSDANMLVTHIILLTFDVVGIIIHDRKQKQA